MSSSNLSGYDEFQNGEIPGSVVFSEQGKLKEVEFPSSVWERARKVFGEDSDPKTIIDFIKSDSASNVNTIGE